MASLAFRIGAVVVFSAKYLRFVGAAVDVWLATIKSLYLLELFTSSKATDSVLTSGYVWLHVIHFNGLAEFSVCSDAYLSGREVGDVIGFHNKIG